MSGASTRTGKRLSQAVRAVSCFALVALASAQESPSADPRWFDHGGHVDEDWNKESEVRRDCRGCHDYRPEIEPEGLDAPADRCVRCHFPGGLPADARLDTSSARVDPSKESERAFRHASHWESKCAECHWDSTRGTGPASIVQGSFSAQSVAYCASCHDDPDKADRDAFNEGLTADTRKRAKDRAQPLAFRHETHLAPEALESKDPSECMKCHASMRDARPDSLAEQQFDTKRCGDCHEGMEFKAQLEEPDGSKIRRASKTAGVFDHKPHLEGRTPNGAEGLASRAAYERLNAEQCLACHALESKSSREGAPRTFALRPEFLVEDTQTACVACHDGWRVEDHGRMDRCASCHRIEPGRMSQHGNLRSNRPSIDVARADPESFAFLTQSHVLVHSERSASEAAGCKKCHVANLGRQPSRLGTQAFRHATHVEQGAKREACLECHFGDEVPTSLRDARLTPVETSAGKASVSYRPDACVRCHGEGAAMPTFASELRTTSLEFDHRAHLNRRSNREGPTLIECSECHVASEPGAPVEITLAAKVADCTLCHGHKGTERAYSGVSATEVQSCVRCHQVGVPAKGEPVPVERARLAVAPGSAQIHSGRKSCRECHRVDAGAAPADAAKVPVELRRVSIVRGGSLSAHDHRKFHPKLSAEEQMNTALQNYLDEAACMDCHWGRMELPRSNHALMEDLTERIKVERLKRYAQYDARDPDAYRRNFGNQLDEPGYSGGFPGVSRPLVK